MTGRSGDCGENIIGEGGTSTGGTSSNNGGSTTAPGETFTSNYNGTMLSSTFGGRQNANLYTYELTINSPNGSYTTSTTSNSSTISTVVSTSQGLYNYPPIALAGEWWLNFSYTVTTNGGGNSAGCWKVIGLGDGYFLSMGQDCPATNQLKKGATNKGSSTLSNCIVTSGGIGINVTLLAVDINRMLGSIELSDDELAFLSKNHAKALQVFKFLKGNNTAENRAFTKLAVKAFLEGAEVDFEDKVFNQLTGPTKDIYDQLAYRTLGTSSILQNIYLFFGNSYRENNVTYKVAKIDIKKTGSTLRNTFTNKDYIITINSEHIYDRAPIEIATTILHESIHAYTMMHQLTSSESFYEIFKAYLKIEKGKDIHHTIMSHEYIIPMADALKSFDNNKENDILYIYLAWDGIPKNLRDPTITDLMLADARKIFRDRGLTTD